mmetsp:Transcript_34407/g.75319  ORF Transcript_34407/g.75319 Transcript_34407/m.75319 type:complete len:218 (-) Transcript_34407:22-675(-)
MHPSTCNAPRRRVSFSPLLDIKTIPALCDTPREIIDATYPTQDDAFHSKKDIHDTLNAFECGLKEDDIDLCYRGLERTKSRSLAVYYQARKSLFVKAVLQIHHEHKSGTAFDKETAANELGELSRICSEEAKQRAHSLGLADEAFAKMYMNSEAAMKQSLQVATSKKQKKRLSLTSRQEDRLRNFTSFHSVFNNRPCMHPPQTKNRRKVVPTAQPVA